ncbi:MAG: hypothetical protein MRZ79_14355 [Bacteroidia bacterium]|nr:hypothetical protein [Bacteroidia bacterium]
MNQHHQTLDKRIQDFRRKYYTDKIIRGSLLLLLITSSILFIVLLSEGIFGFSSSVRTSFVFSLGILFVGVLGYMVLWPVSQLINLTKNISDWQIARMVQKHFPEINDKLTNFLQLKEKSFESGSLTAAAIDQKAEEIAPVQLSRAINLNLNTKYLRLLLIPALLFIATYIINPGLITRSTAHLINYDQEFIPPPPFEISLKDIPKEIVAGEDLKLDISVTGDQLPSELFVYLKNDEDPQSEFIDYSLKKNTATSFEYTLTEIKNDFTFFIGNPESKSEEFKIKVLKRPYIKNFAITIQYPAYTGLAPEKLADNVGDFKALKGSRISWKMEPHGDIQSASLVEIGAGKFDFTQSEDGNLFKASKRLMKDLNYIIQLNGNSDISNIDTVKYSAGIVPDRYPSIYVFSPNNDFLVDLDPVMPLELEVADDFGFSNLQLMYRFVKSGGTSSVSEEFKSYNLGFDKKVLLQQMGYQIDLTSLGLSEGDELEYFIKVWDNDGVSGPKASISATYKAIYPTLDARYDEVSQQQDEVKNDLKKLKENSKSLKESYKKMQEKLLSQKKLSFDDKKELQRMIEEQKEIMKKLEEAQEKFEDAKNKLEDNQMISEQTLQKYEELNKFMEELENPELEEMLKELEERMEDLDTKSLMEKMEDLEMKDEDIQKSLERTLELLKQLEVQEKIDEVRNKLDRLAAKQQVLEEKTEEAKTTEELENIKDRQENLNDQMDEIQKDLDELSEKKEDTKTPDSEKMDDIKEKGEETKEKMDNASESMENSKKEMEDGSRKSKKSSSENKKKASQSQKQAEQKMREMSDELSQMQMDMQSQQNEQNLEDLRELLENLLKLSFDQEDLRNEVAELKYGDPALKDKSQKQKSLEDDMELVRDSLEALANRVFEIQKFVLDESKSITENMDKSQIFFRSKRVDFIKKYQQEAMTGINNLANMLSEVMKQMQQNMMSQMQGNSMCNKPNGKKPNMKGIGQKQQQLNQQMQNMMKMGKMNPSQLQEMAARQEAIRKQLKEAMNQMKGQNGKPLGDMEKVMKDMIQSETDLVNKQLTAETMKRQRQILSRLLQADRSVRERELDDKRESRTAKNLDKKSPEELSLEEYKNKIRQELLKTNKLEYSTDFLILIEQYFKKLETANE